MNLFRRRKQQHEQPWEKSNDDDNAEIDTTFNEFTPTPRKGLRGLFSRKKKPQSQQPPEVDMSTDGSEAEEMQDVFPSSGPPPTFPPNAPHNFRPSVIHSKITEASNESATIAVSHSSKGYDTAVLPPPARQSAFHGPPRFDWIDIEYAAATKIQSVHRRNLVMTSLEQQGLSTSAIRNRRRRRKAVNKSYQQKVQQHAESPSFFNCCSVGFAFGALTEDDEVAYREYQRREYEQRLKQQQEHEDMIRAKYLQEHGMKEANQILEIMDIRN